MWSHYAQEAEEDECHCPPLSPSVYLQSGIAAYGVNSSDSGWVDFISLILSGDILTDVPRVCFHGDSRSSLVDSEDRSSQNRSPEYSSSLWQFACQAWRLGKPKCPQALMLGEGQLHLQDGSLSVAPSRVFLSWPKSRQREALRTLMVALTHPHCPALNTSCSVPPPNTVAFWLRSGSKSPGGLCKDLVSRVGRSGRSCGPVRDGN